MPRLARQRGAVSMGLATFGGFVWYRWLFRQALEGAIKELSGLLHGVETHMNSQRLFSGEAARDSGRTTGVSSSAESRVR